MYLKRRIAHQDFQRKYPEINKFTFRITLTVSYLIYKSQITIDLCLKRKHLPTGKKKKLNSKQIIKQ